MMVQTFPLKIYKDGSNRNCKQTEQKHQQYKYSTKISDIWNITNQPSNVFKEKHKNIAAFFQNGKQLRRQGKNCDQVFNQLPKSISNKQKLSITNITKLRNFSGNTNVSRQFRYGAKIRSSHQLSQFKDYPIDRHRTPLVAQLKQSLSNIDCRIQVTKLKKQYDTLLRIKSMERLSNHELLIIPYTSKQNITKYVLHIGKNTSINDNFINYQTQHLQVAILTKAMVKLSNDTYWCLSWKLVRKKLDINSHY